MRGGQDGTKWPMRPGSTLLQLSRVPHPTVVSATLMTGNICRQMLKPMMAACLYKPFAFAHRSAPTDISLHLRHLALVYPQNTRMLNSFSKKLLQRQSVPGPVRKECENGHHQNGYLNGDGESFHENGGRVVQINERSHARDPDMEEVVRSPYYSEGFRFGDTTCTEAIFILDVQLNLQPHESGAPHISSTANWPTPPTTLLRDFIQFHKTVAGAICLDSDMARYAEIAYHPPPSHDAKDIPNHISRFESDTSGSSCRLPSSPQLAMLALNYDYAGTAMPFNARHNLGIQGLLPSAIETQDMQKRRALVQLRSKETPLEKYIFMAQLRNTNVRLFYRIVCDELEELAPIIYTPTVGKACLEYSNIYPFLAPPGVPDGLYLTLSDLPNLTSVIRNYRPFPTDPSMTPQIAVISDGSRILGLGDLGVNGMGIPIGKLQLYVAGAGIDPRRTLPIVFDVGTNNETFLNDEFYLGVKHKRPSDEIFYPAVDAVLRALHEVYPDLLIQFEDWSSEHAFELLERYQNKIFCFNDDIQGTGAVILSGFINALRIVKEKDNVQPKDHRIVFFGAGSAGIGVAKQLLDYFVLEIGMPEEEAKRLFWIVDSKGLITQDRGDRLAQHKVYFARTDNNGRQFKELFDVVEYVKPTVLIGLSAVPRTFDETVLRRMGELNKQPIIFPLSNPMTQAECSYEEAMVHTKNRCIFASGTAFPVYTVPETGEKRIPGQGNNMYIFPGLGLGSIVAKPKHITNKMVFASAVALAKALTEEEIAQNLLYPSLTRIRQVSAQVAAAVCVQAVQEGLATDPDVLGYIPTDDAETTQHRGPGWERLIKFMESHMWRADQDGYGADKLVVNRSRM
ncbi:hypothetical protein BC936DRAFT_150098 [Jimgerdemannia flammicorona]|uniref:Malic enzyme n=1 Tax=Jimgerdemannia flammicorona TaxID=994334 RepID=A0A433CZI9_9FUNG|nr:hypothetical protein BC936DRAFT_150098 [Jimgerdemannia flammicorona]